MPTKKQKPPKKTGINKGVEKGVSEKQFRDKVFCHKCGKEVGITLGSEMFMKCPRCNTAMERDMGAEKKKVRRIIKLDILRRSKKAQLSFGFTLTLLVLGYNILGYFMDWFRGDWWLIGLASVPFLVISYCFIRGTRKSSASAKYRFYAWLALLVNFAALLVVVASCVPWVVDFVDGFLGR